MQAYRSKLLEYLEKEYESLGAQIDSITDRAGISVSLLTGIAFLVIDSESLASRSICFGEYVFNLRIVLLVFFAMTIVPLIYVLLVKKRYDGFSFKSLHEELYGANSGNISLDETQFYTELLIVICYKNKKNLASLSWCYNFSMVSLCIFILSYLISQ